MTTPEPRRLFVDRSCGACPFYGTDYDSCELADCDGYPAGPHVEPDLDRLPQACPLRSGPVCVELRPAPVEAHVDTDPEPVCLSLVEAIADACKPNGRKP